MARAMWADEHSDGQEAADEHSDWADPATKVKRAEETVAVGKAVVVNASAEASDGNPNPYTEGGGAKSLDFKAKSGGGLEIIDVSEGAGKRER